MSIPHMHKEKAPKRLKFYIAVVSTSRYKLKKEGKPVNDVSGYLMQRYLAEAGQELVARKIIPDDKKAIEEAINEAFNLDADVIVLSGGTGISPDDITIEVVEPLLEKKLPGFGELFRLLSYEEIGSSAIMTRCVAGIRRGRAIFCIPGSPDAVRLAFEKLILPEIGHIIAMARGGHENKGFKGVAPQRHG
ncbi:molybdenum cofactor biosynthesis protein [Candidatus Bathyarchaeota archaeon]|nr:MAG: molybdenum cofactor biosynthesis protein [Candidatus Bathyarchaeota archaeon]